MATIALVMANDKVELPIDSLAKRFEWEGTGEDKRISRIIVRFRGTLYAKVLHYDADGDLIDTYYDPGNESEWCKVNS
jgi:hypothetical protein